MNNKQPAKDYFIACGDCKKTFPVTKTEALATKCPECGSTNIITDRS